MTREQLAEANSLSRAITNLEEQITLAEDMLHAYNYNDIQLICDQVGSITIAGGSQLKDDIIDMVLKHLNKAKDTMENALRLL